MAYLLFQLPKGCLGGRIQGKFQKIVRQLLFLRNLHNLTWIAYNPDSSVNLTCPWISKKRYDNCYFCFLKALSTNLTTTTDRSEFPTIYVFVHCVFTIITCFPVCEKCRLQTGKVFKYISCFYFHRGLTVNRLTGALLKLTGAPFGVLVCRSAVSTFVAHRLFPGLVNRLGYLLVCKDDMLH